MVNLTEINESTCREFKLKDDYNKSKFKWNRFTKGKVKPYFIGFDCETFESDGNLLCLCNSENEEMLSTFGFNTGEYEFSQFVEYFESLKKKTSDMFVAYNLKFDAEVILKSLGAKKLQSFYVIPCLFLCC